jgi:GrpB-like predicted nucleotidyltransferase (UPF0157 family)
MVQHVGSTAVVGLAAKPIIDVDVVVSAPDGVLQVMADLEAVGYRHIGDQGIAGREAFIAPEALPEHHLYVVVENSPPHRDHIDLRDYLREHPDQATRYADEKKRAHLLVTDREAYVEGKSWLVRDLLAAARK